MNQQVEDLLKKYLTGKNTHFRSLIYAIYPILKEPQNSLVRYSDFILLQTLTPLVRKIISSILKADDSETPAQNLDLQQLLEETRRQLNTIKSIDQRLKVEQLLSSVHDFIHELPKLQKLVTKKGMPLTLYEAIQVMHRIIDLEAETTAEPLITAVHARLARNACIDKRTILKELYDLMNTLNLLDQSSDLLLTKLFNRFDLEYDPTSDQKIVAEVLEEIELERFEKTLGEKPQIVLGNFDELSGIEFELYMKEIFTLLGYTVILTKATGDQGADLILSKDLTKTVVQLKKYKTPVSNKAIQEVVAAKSFYKAEKAIVVTTAFYTDGAKELAFSNSVELWDRDKLLQVVSNLSSMRELDDSKYRQDQQRPIDGKDDSIVLNCIFCGAELRVRIHELPALGEPLRIACRNCGIPLAGELKVESYTCEGCKNVLQSVLQLMEHKEECSELKFRRFFCTSCYRPFYLDDTELNQLSSNGVFVISCPRCNSVNTLSRKKERSETVDPKPSHQGFGQKTILEVTMAEEDARVTENGSTPSPAARHMIDSIGGQSEEEVRKERTNVCSAKNMPNEAGFEEYSWAGKGWYAVSPDYVEDLSSRISPGKIYWRDGFEFVEGIDGLQLFKSGWSNVFECSRGSLVTSASTLELLVGGYINALKICFTGGKSVGPEASFLRHFVREQHQVMRSELENAHVLYTAYLNRRAQGVCKSEFPVNSGEALLPGLLLLKGYNEKERGYEFVKQVMAKETESSNLVHCGKILSKLFDKKEDANQCLERAQDLAIIAEDWTSCADGWLFVFNDEEKAKRCLEKGESISKGSGGAGWAVCAKAWMSIFMDSARAQRCLEIGEREEGPSYDLTSCAYMWKVIYDDDERARECLRRAERRAEGHDGGLGFCLSLQWEDCSRAWKQLFDDINEAERCDTKAGRFEPGNLPSGVEKDDEPPGTARMGSPESDSDATRVKDGASADLRPLGVAGIPEGNGIEMVKIPPGTFTMGSPESDSERSIYEVEHRVTISRGFLMGKYSVTQGQWKKVMGKNPSVCDYGDDYPVDGVNWFDAVEFCNRLSALSALKPAYRIIGDGVTWDRTASAYRLPTEAEWEYAARGGKDGEVRYGSLGDVAWYDGNSESKTHPVGKKRPNGFGLYDMLGNVWEWCWDWYDSGYYANSPSKDPHGPERGAGRVVRGGGFNYIPRDVRASLRYWGAPGVINASLGFRCVRDQ